MLLSKINQNLLANQIRFDLLKIFTDIQRTAYSSFNAIHLESDSIHHWENGSLFDWVKYSLYSEQFIMMQFSIFHIATISLFSHLPELLLMF